MHFRKIRQLNQERDEKILALSTMYKKSDNNESNKQLTYSVLRSPKNSQCMENNMVLIKNLDNNQISFVNEKQLDILFESFSSLPQIPYQTLIQHYWNNYLSDVEKQEEEFLQCCYQGDLKTIQRFLQNKCKHPIDIRNVINVQGKNAIHISVISESVKNIDVIYLLAKHEVDINLQTLNEKRTPLMLGCIIGSAEAVKALLQLGANFSIQDFQGNTALHHACLYNQQQIVEILVNYECSIDIKNHKKLTPIEYITNYRIFQIIRSSSKFPTMLKNEENEEEGLVPNSRFNQIQKIISKLSNTNNDEYENSSIVSNTNKKNMKSRSQYRQEKYMQMVQKTNSIKQTKLSNFIKKTLLGRGAFGEVFLVEHNQTHKHYAIKSLDKNYIIKQNILRYAMTEKKILSTIDSPFIVKLHYSFQTSDKLFLIMDYCPGGDLLKIIKKNGKLNQDIVKKYTCEIILALEKLHQAEIIYRDLKPGNIVLDRDGHALLTDFGLSKQASLAHSFCGSTAYLAPQMLWRRGHTKVLDWYLLGVLIYQCLTGKPPFWDTNKEKLLSNIKTGKYKPIGNEYSPQVRDIVAKLLVSNHSKRLGVNGGSQVRAHKWFKEINWKDVQMKKLVMDKIEQVEGKPIKQQCFEESQILGNKVEGWQYNRQLSIF